MKTPDYITAAEAAEKWGVSQRQVNRLLAVERIPGVKQFGKRFLIPSKAEKPGDPRFEKKLPRKSLSSYLAYVIEASTKPLPRDNPDVVFDYIDEEWLRIFCEGVFAYFRGDYERVIQNFLKIRDDEIAPKLRYCSQAIAAAISTGDYPLYLEIETFCKDLIKLDLGADVTAVAELTLSDAYVGAFAPNMIPNWLKNGDFTALPSPLRPDAICKRTRYLHYEKKYESALEVARTALAFDEPDQGISYSSFYLRIMCAISCCNLDRMDDAEKYLSEAMNICLPHGFIVNFAEHGPLFCGLLERLLKWEYPAYYDAVTRLSDSISPNWLDFHNHFTKDNITLMLSSREYQIARLAALGSNDKQIGKQLNLAMGTVKNRVDEICAKLFLSGRNRRKELAKYIL